MREHKKELNTTTTGVMYKVTPKTSGKSGTMKLAKTKYQNWSELLTAVWLHGMSRGNMDQKLVKFRAFRAGEAMGESLTRENEARYIRPSAFLSCARQTWFMRQGYKPEPMPENIGLTFAMGHALHELSYAAVESALPSCFKVEFEKKVTLPKWWRDAVPESAEHGHIDCLITVEDEEEAAEYIELGDDKTILVDFKTMGGFTSRGHAKKDFAQSADGFGYLSQLAIYSNAVRSDVVLLAGINRDQLTAPLSPRKIDLALLDQERERILNALTCEDDPCKEFLERWGKDAHFYCGIGGRKGYCPFADRCEATYCADQPS
ncbi:MAG: hypothetical protein QF599_00360 [Planctomycetota bacterium]|nr:hypothetical protein [Planctomycetota bacterium]